jgi:biotin carboxyl carrier protein
LRYFVTIGDRTVEVDLTGPRPRVEGEEVDAALGSGSGWVRHLLVGSESHALLAEPGERKGSWKVTLNGRPLMADVVDERTRAIREMAGTVETEGPKTVVAPMPGLVVRISVEAGQPVTAGQGVVVVEAMKMENELRAPADGVVARIEVVPGQAVEKGAVLLVLE